MKTYSEVDLNETPKVVLGCSYFFTAETLDGHIRIMEVYTIDRYSSMSLDSQVSRRK